MFTAAAVAAIVKESPTELYDSTRVELELADQFAQSLFDRAKSSGLDSVVATILCHHSYYSG